MSSLHALCVSASAGRALRVPPSGALANGGGRGVGHVRTATGVPGSQVRPGSDDAPARNHDVSTRPSTTCSDTTPGGRRPW
jgi:hypothetical protein